MSSKKSRDPLVSVILPCYNGEKYLSQTLESIFTQSYRDFEIIFLDDGSTDNSAKIVNDFQRIHPGVINYCYQENKGISISRNNAIKKAKGAYIAFIDADDIWAPNKLEESISLLDSNEDVVLVHTQIQCISEKGEQLETPHSLIKYQSGSIFKELYYRKANIATSSAVFRKNFFDQGNIFDPNLTYLGCEDRDYWLSLSKTGKIHFINAPLVSYMIRANSMSSNTVKMNKAREYVAKKHMSHFFSPWIALRRASSVIKKEEADKFYYQSDFIKAMKSYANSIILFPFSVFPFINILKCLLKLTKKTK